MNKKFARFSFSQLLLLQYLLAHAFEVLTVSQIAKHTPLKSKVLGGVLSSLSRTKFRGISLIEPLGRAQDGGGLRWRLNATLIDVNEAKKEVRRLLASY